jgi:hypothetical protein
MQIENCKMKNRKSNMKNGWGWHSLMTPLSGVDEPNPSMWGGSSLFYAAGNGFPFVSKIHGHG